MSDVTIADLETDGLDIRFVLEMRKPDNAAVFHELTWVDTFSLESPMDAIATYGIDDRKDPAVQRSRNRRETITLSGSFGMELRSSHDGLGSFDALDGYGRVAALRRFLSTFVEESAKTEGPFIRQTNKVELWLHCLQENESFRLVNADLQRTTTTDTGPGDSQWNLRCVTMRRVTREVPPPPALDAPAQSSATLTGAALTTASARATSDAAIAASKRPPVQASWENDYDLFAKAKIGIEKHVWLVRNAHMTLSEPVQANLGGITRALYRLENLRDAVLRGASDVSAFFCGLIGLLTDAKKDADALAAEIEDRADAGEAADALHDVASFWGDMLVVLTTRLAQERTPYTRPAEGVIDGPARPVRRTVNIGNRTFILVFTLEGETVLEFARRTLGDAGRWAEIVEANEMHDPNTLRDGSPFTIGGVALLVPAVDGARIASANLQADLIGSAYQLDPETSDLTVDPGGLRRTGGLPLVLQAIRERARNVRGRTLAAPDWGLLPIVGTVPDRSTVSRFAVDARAQFYRDPRVTRIDGVTVQREGDTITLSLAVDTVTAGGDFVLSTPIAIAR